MKYQGLAVSDSFKRRWGSWHHILDPGKNGPVETLIGVTALAPTAFEADCMTSGLFLGAEDDRSILAKEYQAEYVVFGVDSKVMVSPRWPGKLF